ncbi:MAG: hypothetical protein QM539_06010, partial [Alphaproteobacteria bacterium]|nr:hypothetical protein [Alphaproteobacteria bacterium]
MIKLFIALGIGIYLGLNYPNYSLLQVLGLIIGGLAIVLLLFKIKLRFRFNWFNFLRTAILLLIMITLGYWRAIIYKDVPTPFVQNNIKQNASVFQFKISDNLGSSKKFYKYEAYLDAIIIKDSV